MRRLMLWSLLVFTVSLLWGLWLELQQEAADGPRRF